jgi:Flp pilus assembly CpaF family ATPase
VERVVADPTVVDELRHTVGDALVDQRRRFELQGNRLDGDDEKELSRQLIDEAVRDYAARELTMGRAVSELLQAEYFRAVWAAIYEADRLQLLLDRADVENVNIIGYDKVFVKYAGGRKERYPGTIADDDEDLINLVRRMAGWVGLSSRPWDATNPMLRLRLPHGERLTGIAYVCDRPSVSIRRNLHPNLTLDRMVELGSSTPEVAAFLKAAVGARLTLAIAGDQKSGKTTTSRALIREIPPDERIFCAEESLELDIAGLGVHEDVVELEARGAYGEMTGRVTLTDLVRAMLTQDADRQIVGECTGPEVIALLNATLSGSGGSLTTIHTKKPKGVPNRIASFASQAEERLSWEASMQLVAEALDLVVYMRLVRDRTTGQTRRVISDIVEIGHWDGKNVMQSALFEYDAVTGQAVPQDGLMMAECMDRLIDAGFDPYKFGLVEDVPEAGGWGRS